MADFDYIVVGGNCVVIPDRVTRAEPDTQAERLDVHWLPVLPKDCPRGVFYFSMLVAKTRTRASGALRKDIGR